MPSSKNIKVLYSSLKQRLLASDIFKDSFWALVGNVFGRGLALLASIIIARMLGKDLFGMYGLIRTTLLNVAVFSTFGLGITATKYIAEYLQSKPEKIGSLMSNIMQITIATAGVFAVLIFLFSKQLASYLNVPELHTSIKFLAVIVIFNSITTTQTGVLAGFKRFKQIARINLINGIATFVLGTGFTYWWGLDGALIALLVSQILLSAQFYFETRRATNTIAVKKTQKMHSTRSELITFSLPVAMQEMTYSIHAWLIPILIVKMSNFGETGIYNAVAQWSSVILFIPGTLQNVVLSHVSSNAGQFKQQSRILNRMLLVNFISTAIPCLLVFCFSVFIEKMYGGTFNGLATVLNIAVFTTIFNTMINVIRQYILSINKPWLNFWQGMARLVLGLGLFILLMYCINDEKGALRMVQANFTSQMMIFLAVYCWYHIHKKTHMQT